MRSEAQARSVGAGWAVDANFSLQGNKRDGWEEVPRRGSTWGQIEEKGAQRVRKDEETKKTRRHKVLKA